MPDAAVVVVAHRSHEWLAPCLESVVDQCSEFIVVDNGSERGAVGDIARDYATEVVRLEKNAGFAGGANAGIVRADSELVALLNDDAFAGPGWLESAAAILADESYAAVGPKLLIDRPYGRLRLSDPSIHIGQDPRLFGRQMFTATAGGVDVLDRLTGGVHPVEHGMHDGSWTHWRWTIGGSTPVMVPLDPDIDPDGLLINGEPVEVDPVRVDLLNSAGAFLTRRGFGGDIGFLAPDVGQFDDPADRFAVSGAAMVTTKRVLRNVGMFASHFFAYYEDLDWSWRAQLHGFRIRYDPSVSVRHVGGATSGGPDNATVKRLAARNRMLTLARNAPLGVLLRQIRDERAATASAWRLPVAVAAERPILARKWQRSPGDVWDQWAGVDEV